MNDNAKKLCEFLGEAKIPVKIYEHQPVYTVEDVKKAELNIPGIPTKNLFLRNKKKTNYYLYISQEDKKIDFRTLSQFLDDKGITFASEQELVDILGLELGNVGPFGIVNDMDNVVQILIDSGLVNEKDINLSANSLSTTLTIDYEYLLRFIQINGNKYRLVNIESN